MPRQTIQQKALKSVEQYLGRICGVDVDDDGTDYQRRLILGEEEDLPQLAPDTRRRGPYMSPALASVTSPVPRANTAGLLSQYRAAAAGAGPSDIPVVPPNVQRRIAAEAHGLKPDARLDGGFAGFPEPPGAPPAAAAPAAAAAAEPPADAEPEPELDVAAVAAQVAALEAEGKFTEASEELRKLVT